MKLYTKIIDGLSHIMPANRIVVIKDDMQIFNPTEDILLSDGWKEYIAPENELTDEQILAQEKEIKINDITEYDASDDVNIFYVNDIPMWLDKATRVGLMLRFNAEIESGKTETILWFNGISFPLQLSMATKMLNAIELYASTCYDNTQQHIANVKNITTIDELKQYDYTSGYPEKLRF